MMASRFPTPQNIMDHTLLKIVVLDLLQGRKLTSSEKLRLMDYLAKDSSQDLSSPTNANHDRESLTIHLLQKSKLPTRNPSNSGSSN